MDGRYLGVAQCEKTNSKLSLRSPVLLALGREQDRAPEAVPTLGPRDSQLGHAGEGAGLQAEKGTGASHPRHNQLPTEVLTLWGLDFLLSQNSGNLVHVPESLLLGNDLVTQKAHRL